MTDDPNLSTATYRIPSDEARLLPPPPDTAAVRVEAAGRSHVGRIRHNNEDSFLIARLDRRLTTLATNLPAGLVPDSFGEVGYGTAVADGVGGAAAGEVASRLAVSSYINLVLNSPDWLMRLGPDDGPKLAERIAAAFCRVSDAVRDRGDEDRRLAGMSTTLTMAYSLGRELFIGHVGDSRAYLLRGGRLLRLTRDHTVAQALADQGLSADDAWARRHAHALTQVIGVVGNRLHPDVDGVGLRDGDQLLLCTDGLSGVVPDAAIRDRLAAAASAEAACDALIAAALAAGGPDNVTAVVTRYGIPGG